MSSENRAYSDKQIYSAVSILCNGTRSLKANLFNARHYRNCLLFISDVSSLLWT